MAERFIAPSQNRSAPFPQGCKSMTKFYLIAATLLICSGPAGAAVRNFFAPQWDGERIDACLAGKLDCGKPAADAFCKAEGFDSAVLFQREAMTLTRRLGSNERCEGAGCTGFRQIKCFSSKGDFAGLQLPGE